MSIRAKTQKAIDALHEQIAALIEREKAYHNKKHPDENSLWRHVSHTRIEMARHCPQDRASMVEAVASFPRAAP